MHKNWIAGQWLGSDNVQQNLNPSDLSDVVGEYVRASADDVEMAIASAHAAWPTWSLSTPQQRFDALDMVGTELLARKAELGELLAREEGKTLPEAIAEVGRAGQIFKFFAGEALRLEGEALASVRPGIQVEVSREPIGVVGIITPWNFPIAIPAWKIAPALAYGNCVVFKPADLVPGSAWALAEILSRSGLPEGVFNLVMGRGSVVGAAFIEDPRVEAITFTGSVPTGRQVLEQAAAGRKKVQLEMGGKNPLVVLDDANLETALDCTIQGAFYSTGQRCTASSRIIVQRGIYDQFTSELARRTQQLRVGHALRADTQIGPVSEAPQLEQNLSYIKIGKQEGARLLCGGEQLERDTNGFYFSPAVFADADSRMRIAQEEIFGPVATVIPADDYEHALALANDTEFGLSSGICTQSLKHAAHFKRSIQAGMVMVNVPTAGVDYHVPFGGRKGSSYGPREQGRYAREFFTVVKTAYTAA
ncbi:MAG TPA: aldehyde dehydrogenase family protein [Pusillimonas sp.]|uniref:aldehyde dehydrogenase family protein n=1 Tax=Pusillimonas sp. TaxID=3040095 RepID=UPI002B4B66CA|nr:aldehyde dehydrogenase family protein [Pusillimonas sp.]HLU19956.1 aldehyde dehydrogenase family protein [Pusillimonas sp.]